MSRLSIERQPDWTTCGPTALHAVYRYHGDDISLDEVIAEVPVLKGGGTLGVLMANHALRRGYEALLYTYNLEVFDPSWFTPKELDLCERLQGQLACKPGPALEITTAAYLEFLDLGGKACFADLTPGLLRRYLQRRQPILTGLSATYLYHAAREKNDNSDDLGGEPAGHFVILTGYSARARTVDVADPLLPNPFDQGQHYHVAIERLIGAIFLGVLTHDANLLVIRPPSKRQGD